MAKQEYEAKYTDVKLQTLVTGTEEGASWRRTSSKATW